MPGQARQLRRGAGAGLGQPAELAVVVVLQLGGALDQRLPLADDPAVACDQVTMRTRKITKDEATVWFSRDELGFMIAATARALQEMDPDEFFTRTGRTVGYANAVLARLRVANGEGRLREEPYSPEGDDRTPRVPYNPRMPTSEQVVMKVERVDGDKALISLADHELYFLNDAINEAVHGLRGVEEFERSSGKTRKYGVRLMDQLIAANDRIEDLN